MARRRRQRQEDSVASVSSRSWSVAIGGDHDKVVRVAADASIEVLDQIEKMSGIAKSMRVQAPVVRIVVELQVPANTHRNRYKEALAMEVSDYRREAGKGAVYAEPGTQLLLDFERRHYEHKGGRELFLTPYEQLVLFHYLFLPPDSSTKEARRQVMQTIYRIRKRIGKDFLKGALK